MANATTTALYVHNEDQPSASVGNGEITRDEQCPIATDQTGDAVSKPLRALSRSTLIASLYDHASALAQAGDITAARVAHEAAGRLLQVPEVGTVVDLNQRRTLTSEQQSCRGGGSVEHAAAGVEGKLLGVDGEQQVGERAHSCGNRVAASAAARGTRRAHVDHTTADLDPEHGAIDRTGVYTVEHAMLGHGLLHVGIGQGPQHVGDAVQTTACARHGALARQGRLLRVAGRLARVSVRVASEELAGVGVRREAAVLAPMKLGIDAGDAFGAAVGIGLIVGRTASNQRQRA